jgi:polyisoprenoid-binding protein YceI
MATELDTERGIVRVPTGTWTVDPAHSSIEFRVKHMMISTVRGRFGEFEGTIEAAPDYHDSKVRGTIEAASIDTNEPRRDEHLRSADFFDVETFPSITFRSARIADATGDRFKLIGDLTIHGVTREVTLDVTAEGRGKDPWGGERAGFSAATKIKRSEFGLTWNQALETGGFVVGDDIKISLDVEVVKQA